MVAEDKLAASQAIPGSCEPLTLTSGSSPSEADAGVPYLMKSAKKKMQNIRAAIPATPVVAQELRSLGYFQDTKPASLKDVRAESEQSRHANNLLRTSGTEVLRSKSRDYQQEVQHTVLGELVQSDLFEGVVLFMICLNALFIGIETDAAASDESRHTSKPVHFEVIEVIFMIFFSVELAVRIFVFRWWFFSRSTPMGRKNPNFGWNMFDSVIVGIQVFDRFLKAIIDFEDSPLGKSTILRFLRVLRVARLLRMGKVLRFFRTLRTIIHSIFCSASLFVWSVVSLMLLNYLFAVYIVEIISDDLHKEAVDPDLKLYFGTVQDAMLSMAMGTTGGVDWGELYFPLMRVSRPFAAWPFYVFVMFLVVVTMNVFTGVIFDSVQKRDKQENELELVVRAFHIFQDSDQDGTGTICKDDFKAILANPELQKFFNLIDLDIQQAEVLFDLLDSTSDGSISCSEFLRGCLRLQGTTKALDLLILSQEVTQLFEEIASINKQNEESARLQRQFLASLAVENSRLLRALQPGHGKIPE